MVGWVFFRSETIAQAWAFLQALAGKAAAAPTPFLVTWYLTPELWLALGAAVVGAMPSARRSRDGERPPSATRRGPPGPGALPPSASSRSRRSSCSRSCRWLREPTTRSSISGSDGRRQGRALWSSLSCSCRCCSCPGSASQSEWTRRACPKPRCESSQRSLRGRGRLSRSPPGRAASGRTSRIVSRSAAGCSTWRTDFLWHRLGSSPSSTVFAGKDGLAVLRDRRRARRLRADRTVDRRRSSRSGGR